MARRKLVEQARRDNEGKDRVRRTHEAAYRFMSAMAGNLPDFEEAVRALFAADQERLHELIQIWPQDIQEHLIRLLQQGAEAAAQPEALALPHRPLTRACRSP